MMSKISLPNIQYRITTEFFIVIVTVLVDTMNSECGVINDFRGKWRPIIGIFTQPSTQHTYSFIPSSYVKWIEAGGGRVIPIHYDYPNEELEKLFCKVNGILLPGGSHSLKRNTKFMKANVKILELAKRENDKNNPFPIFGTCQGFQVLSIIAPDVYKDENIPAPNYSPQDILFECKGTRRSSLPVKFFGKSRIFSKDTLLGPSFKSICEKESATLNSHQWGVDLKTWKSAGLNKEFNIISTSVDVEQTEFISIFEHKCHPIYSVQFHPEKVSFEDQPPDIETSMNSIMLNLYLSSFLVNEAKLNSHRTSEKDGKLFMGNFRPETSYGYFRSSYYFKREYKQT